MRFALLVSYDGTHFSGWQRQKNGRTVQGVLEEAAAEIFGVPVKITGCGRTDAGVHAVGQVCHFDAETHIPARKIRECFNRILPSDVAVRESVSTSDDFDCTRSGKKKTYVYRAYYAESKLPLFERYEARLTRQPDLKKMLNVCEILTGEHDFAAFRASGFTSRTSVRTLYFADVACHRGGGALHYEFTVCGNGFLYNMVRILAGELFEIGYGKGTDALKRAFETGERRLLAKTMPPNGLSMLSVEYDVPLFELKEEKSHGIF